MRVLLDECVPRQFGRFLTGHDVVTVAGKGWAGIKNGSLLTVAQTEFDVMITVDRSIPHQQKISDYRIALIILITRDTKLDGLRPLVPSLLLALQSIQPGSLLYIDT